MRGLSNCPETICDLVKRKMDFQSVFFRTDWEVHPTENYGIDFRTIPKELGELPKNRNAVKHPMD